MRLQRTSSYKFYFVNAKTVETQKFRSLKKVISEVAIIERIYLQSIPSYEFVNMFHTFQSY